MATNVQTDISQAHFSNVRPPLKSSQVQVAGGVAAGTYTEAQNINTLEVYLLANGYTQVQLDKMTKNDKIYAYRLKKGTTVAP